MIKVGLIGNSQLHRKALVLAVNSFDHINVMIDEDNLFSFIGSLKNDAVDVVIIDLPLAVVMETGICQILKNNLLNTKILLIVHAASAENGKKRLSICADGIISANGNLTDLENAVENLAKKKHKVLKSGQNSLSGKIYTMDGLAKLKVLQPVELTAREIDVIKLIGKEYNSLQIAAKLNISLNTVESHRKKIMVKTASKNFIGVVIYALKNNFIKINDLSADQA